MSRGSYLSYDRKLPPRSREPGLHQSGSEDFLFMDYDYDSVVLLYIYHQNLYDPPPPYRNPHY